MRLLHSANRSLLIATVLAISACGGGGSSTASDPDDTDTNSGGPPVNSAPTASAGADSTVVELSTVLLDGSASGDPDGDTLSFAWLQTAGPDVVLSDANVAQPSFTAPDVTAPAILSFQLTVDDGSASATDTVSITVQEALSAVTVAGTLRFEWVNPKNNCRGLDLNNPVPRRMRGITVQLLDSSNAVLDTTVSDEQGRYAFSDVAANQEVRIRVRAELISSAPARWNVEVRDNTASTNLPLTRRPLYVVQWPLFNSGSTNIADADFIARTGWDGSSYSGERAAAPFAILDSVLAAMNMVTDVDPTVTFPDLDVYWSVNNTLTSPTDIDAGELSSTFYSDGGLFMLGDASTDTEEFDDHVSIHEWGHYFEDKFSRSDSFGGRHFIGEPLDPRVAFGEGFASALAAIALQDPIYCDTSGPNLLSSGFGINWESAQRLQGWFNEWSVGAMIYDLWDTAVDGSDDSSIGFGPIYETMVGPQRDGLASTTMFSFAAGLRPMLNSADLAFVDAQLNRINVDTPAVVDDWGDTQTTTPTDTTYPLGRDMIPYSIEIQVNAAPINVCMNNDYFPNYAGDDGENKFGMFRHFRFTTNSTSSYTITATANPAPPATTGPGDAEGRNDSDPDLFLNRTQEWFSFASSTEDGNATEVWTTPALDPGTYILRLQEWRHVDDTRDPEFPSQVCFDVSVAR